MADSTLAALTAATAGTGGLYYGTQAGADRKFTMTAAGAVLAEAANAAAQVTALGVLSLTGGTLTGQVIQSTNGAESTPPVLLTGKIFTGGSATTTKPAFLIEPTGTTSTGWSTAGTLFGGNAPSGFTGNLLDLQVSGASVAKLSQSVGVATLSIQAVRLIIGTIDSNDLGIFYNGGRRALFGTPTGGVTGLHLYEEEYIGWTAAALAGGAVDDLALFKSAASVLGLVGASAGGAALELLEMTAPSAPGSNKARIFAEDNGVGKTRLMVRFPSGASQQIAIEP